MDVDAKRRTPSRNPPHLFPNISPTGHRTPTFPSNAIELTTRWYWVKVVLLIFWL
jgi:hypothetical protein